MKLPSMLHADTIRRAVQVKFGGFRHTQSAGEGEIYDMRNLTGDDAPVIASRAPRYTVRTLTKPNGLCAYDELFWVDGTYFYADGVQRGTVTDTEKRFTCLGAYVIILPDKAYYNRLTQEFGSLQSERAGAVTIGAGTFAGETAEGNTIRATDVNWADYFRVGDAVTVSGCTVHPGNNKTAVIREIEGNELRFYEYAFTVGEEGDSESSVTVCRAFPDLDYICVNANRLWGCKDDTVYASKLGDPFNFNVFDGLSTDSYAVNAGSAGGFTGCVSYLGYAVFFKEDQIYKIYGAKPSNFKLMASASLGVAQGSHASLAIAGDILFYLSREGVMAYSGSTPRCVSGCFGELRCENGVGAGNGAKYLLSVQSGEGNMLLTYDTRTQLWMKEDSTRLVGAGRGTELYLLSSDGKMFLCGEAQDVPEGAVREEKVESMLLFGDFTEQEPFKKGVGRILLRMSLEAGSTVTVSLMFDSDGVWRRAGKLRASSKRTFEVPIIPRRCDHYRIRIEGEGDWKLYSMARESYAGSKQ